MINDDQQPEPGKPVGERHPAVVDGTHLAPTRRSQHDAVPLQLAARSRLTEIVQQRAGNGPGQAALVLAERILGVDRVVGQDRGQLGDQSRQVPFLRRQSLDLLSLAGQPLPEPGQQLLAAVLGLAQAGQLRVALARQLVDAGLFGRHLAAQAWQRKNRGRDGLEGIDLRDRCLELFKVVSREGVPEVWSPRSSTTR